jgi:hypothetical protein
MDGNTFRYMKSAMMVLIYLSNNHIKDFNQCNITIKQLIEDINKEQLILSNDEKVTIIGMHGLIQNQEKIESYRKLTEALIAIPIPVVDRPSSNPHMNS